MQFTVIGNEDGTKVISVFAVGRKPEVASSDHPNFDRIYEGALAGDESIFDLFNIAKTAATKFEALSDRYSVKGGQLFLDGEVLNDAFAKQVVRFLDEGNEDWKGLVKFGENILANPNEHSREQLFTWLSNHDFTITDEGMIVGYKGVQAFGGGFFSIHQGRAIVNGEEISGQIPNPIGAIVEMPRSEVHHDPSTGCSTGLHVADFDYAKSYGSTVLEVEVNPRDVVSVPTDSNWSKVRCCRYKVIGVVHQSYNTALKPSTEVVGDPGWGDGEDDDFELCECGGYPVEDCDCVLGVDDDVYADDEVDEVVLSGIAGSNQVPTSTEVLVGERYEDRDSRRGGRYLLVIGVDPYNGVATCKSSSSGKTVNVSTDRLLSRKYRKI